MTPTSPAPSAAASGTSASLSAETPYALELVAVTKRYLTVTALSDINLEIEPGEFVVLLGPSGCGKSTILKVIAGLEDATEGEVYINGNLANYVRPKERDVSMVFQNYALYPHMTVERNLGFPLKMRGSKKQEVTREVAQVADLLELTDQLKKYPEQLSGGQRQRVALGRAIIRNPVAFLMDEPLSNLDALLRVQMRSELLKLHRRVGKTTVYVTHDQVEAMTMADRIVVLRAGVVQQVSTTHGVYSRPANIFVATFVGSPQMNLFSGRVEKSDGGRRFVGPVTMPLDGSWPDLPADRGVTLGIRPEDIELLPSTAPGVTASGAVELVEDVGAEDYLSVAIGGLTCTVRTNVHGAAKEGEWVALGFLPASLHLFDEEGLRIERR
jgi:multiple sugar transport system ATP-binding protein